MGRKQKIDDILNHIDEIKKLKSEGATDYQIAASLGICMSTFYKYLKENDAFRNAINDGKLKVVDDLVGELYKKARVHSLITVKTIERGDETIIETTTKEVDSDTQAITFLLKNLDREHWSSEPNALELKKKELELKEKNMENNLW